VFTKNIRKDHEAMGEGKKNYGQIKKL